MIWHSDLFRVQFLITRGNRLSFALPPNMNDADILSRGADGAVRAAKLI